MRAPTVKQLVVAIDKLIALRRNPQYLSERQNKALRQSIERDGFLCPVVIRKAKHQAGLYEVLSGNHRVIASREAGRVAKLYALYAQKDLTT